MKKIYVVLSDELLDDDAWHTDTCRAFDSKRDANTFASHLSKMFANEDIETVFYVKEVQFGKQGCAGFEEVV
jgi:hypothetical protein